MSEHDGPASTTIDLADLDRLAAAATPPPWSFDKRTSEIDPYVVGLSSTRDGDVNLSLDDEDGLYIVAACNAVPTLLTLVTAADAFVAAYTAYHAPWVLESSREGLTAERAMAHAVAAYQAARGRQAREEGS